jgi:ferric-chelate reductase
MSTQSFFFPPIFKMYKYLASRLAFPTSPSFLLCSKSSQMNIASFLRDAMVTVLPRSHADHALIDARDFDYPKQIVYLIVSFIALISLCHFFSMFYHFIIRKRVHERNRRTAVSLTRVPAAVGDSFRTLAFRWTVPVGSSHELNFAEVGLALAYMAVLFTWSLINSTLNLFPLRSPNSHSILGTSLAGIKLDPNYYADRAGNIAAAQLPILVALAAKNNLISCKFKFLP